MGSEESSICAASLLPPPREGGGGLKNLSPLQTFRVPSTTELSLQLFLRLKVGKIRFPFELKSRAKYRRGRKPPLSSPEPERDVIVVHVALEEAEGGRVAVQEVAVPGHVVGNGELLQLVEEIASGLLQRRTGKNLMRNTLQL